MLKFPLKTNIELISIQGDIFPCIIKYAGEKTLHIQDVHKRIYESNGDTCDIKIQDLAYVDRDKFLGYSFPKNSLLKEEPKNNIIKLRSKMKKDEFTLLEEELTKKFNLTKNTEQTNSAIKIPIPQDWIYDMYNFITNAIGGFESSNINRKTNSVSIIFKDKKDKDSFVEKFEKGFKSNINMFLEKIKQVDPKKYIKDRTYLVTETDKSINITI